MTHDRPSNPTPGASAIVGLVATGTLDAELAALLWLLADARVPFVVAGEPGSGRGELRTTLAGLLPPDTRLVTLRGEDEDFAWMPEATELGWRRERSGLDRGAGAGASPSTTVLVADLEDRPRTGTWGERARVAIRSLSIGYGMAATARGGRLEDVLARLAAPPVGAIDDELARLGVALLLTRDAAGRPRVTAAHYLRPVSRDVHGHVQRMAPAVLATWDAATDRFEHFSWGIVAELAGRMGMAAGAFEREQARRTGHLAGLAARSGETARGSV